MARQPWGRRRECDEVVLGVGKPRGTDVDSTEQNALRQGLWRTQQPRHTGAGDDEEGDRPLPIRATETECWTCQDRGRPLTGRAFVPRRTDWPFLTRWRPGALRASTRAGCPRAAEEQGSYLARAWMVHRHRVTSKIVTAGRPSFTRRTKPASQRKNAKADQPQSKIARIHRCGSLSERLSDVLW